ncbi:MAG: cytochrome c biogenesis protein CcdA [Chloroflexi bacterium]|nr:cytochrome c biogenesis protein CcdA [Chloroflexota bacterium]
MNLATLTFAFSAGLLASVNPCGFAMLPSFVAFYLGADSDDFASRPAGIRLLAAARMGLLVTAGFMVLFIVAGTFISLGGYGVVGVAPGAAIVIDLVLIGWGLWWLTGRSIHLDVPLPAWELRQHTSRAMFLYGIFYAIVSLGCTLPIFLVTIGSALHAGNVASGLVQFIAYASGMGTVLMVVAIATALLQNTLIHSMRHLMPRVQQASAALLVLAGSYLLLYQFGLLPSITLLFGSIG